MPETLFEAPSLESIGSMLPAYEFDFLIAQGGMGAVYKACQISLDRDVAIKVLPRQMGSDPAFRKSFEAEAKAMARLTHPNLIGVYDSGDVDGLLYIVMEFVPGQSLFHSAHDQAIDPKQAVDIIIAVCQGLDHAHENGIVHRDVKPANILLTPKCAPKIGDFGLAQPEGQSAEGLAMGTPGYVAPEVIHHPEMGDQRSDIFAIGIVLNELLTGVTPEDGKPLSPIADNSLSRICTKATDPSPDRRYPDALAMVADLEAWIKSKSAVVRPVPRVTQPVSLGSSGSSSGSGSMGLILGACVLGAILLTWVMLRGDDEKGEQTSKDDPALVGHDPVEVEDRVVLDVSEEPPVKEDRAIAVEETVVQEVEAPKDSMVVAEESESRDDLVAEKQGSNESSEPSISTFKDPDELVELMSKAEDLLGALDSEKGKALEENVEGLTEVVTTWFVGLTDKEEMATMAHSLLALKSLGSTGRIPDGIVDLLSAYPDDLLQIIGEYVTKQEAIDELFKPKAVTVRDAYVKRLETTFEDYDGEGHGELSKRLEVLTRQAADLDGWLASFGVFEAKAPSHTGFVIVSAVWGIEENTVLITPRVSELMTTVKSPFKLNAASMGTDPAPYKTKFLTVKYVLNGVPDTRQWQNGSRITPKKFLEGIGAE